MTLMIAAPLLATVEMNGPFKYSSSLTTYLNGWPFTVAWKVSGYCVAEWLPQTMMFSIASSGAPVFALTYEIALIWSRRVMAVKFFFGIDGA